MPTASPAAHIDLTEALSRLSGADGPRFATVFEHGSLKVEIYAPRDRDLQTPHTRDEAYVVARGEAVFFDGKRRRPCGPGTFLFVRAGRPHRFEDFSADFAVWVLFYGPEGGEAGPQVD